VPTKKEAVLPCGYPRLQRHLPQVAWQEARLADHGRWHRERQSLKRSPRCQDGDIRSQRQEAAL